MLDVVMLGVVTLTVPSPPVRRSNTDPSKEVSTAKIASKSENKSGNRVTRRKGKKKLPNFSKNSPRSHQVKKKAKISTTKLNLRAQNIIIKPLLKP
jgi:hypothetical protein